MSSPKALYVQDKNDVLWRSYDGDRFYQVEGPPEYRVHQVHYPPKNSGYTAHELIDLFGPITKLTGGEELEPPRYYANKKVNLDAEALSDIAYFAAEELEQTIDVVAIVKKVRHDTVTVTFELSVQADQLAQVEDDTAVRAEEAEDAAKVFDERVNWPTTGDYFEWTEFNVY